MKSTSLQANLVVRFLPESTHLYRWKDQEPEITQDSVTRLIESGKFEVECILNLTQQDNIPTLIITEKQD